MNATCILCQLKKYMEAAIATGDDAAATAFCHELIALYAASPKDYTSPHLVPTIEAMMEKYFGRGSDDFAEEKVLSNRFIVQRMPKMRQIVQAAPDPVLAGLQFSILGNYIDFSALNGQVSFEKLDDMMAEALKMELDTHMYLQFCRDLETGKRLLYITDNAGEIGFDQIFAEQLQKKYPHLEITFCVRGAPAHNDATREDAAAVGVTFPVIDNGNNIAGTVISQLSPESRAALEAADVVIAKGMGNTETMFGCGFNVYYAFLVKCVRFVQKFGRPLMTPMFIRDEA